MEYNNGNPDENYSGENYSFNGLRERIKETEQKDIAQAEKYISLCRQRGEYSHAMVFI